MIKTSIEGRNEVFEFIKNIKDSNGIEYFPPDIKVLSTEAGTEINTTRVFVDREIPSGMTTATISYSLTTNGSFSINQLSPDRKSFIILKKFDSNDTGILVDTGRIYKDSINDIKNFPAILIEIGEIDFRYNNKNMVDYIELNYVVTIVDLIENHKSSSAQTSLEATQDFTQNRMIDLMEAISQSKKVLTKIENIDTFEIPINDDKKCSCSYAGMVLINR